MPLILKGVVKDQVTIGNYTFEVRGLNRAEVFEFQRRVKELKKANSDNDALEAMVDAGMLDWLLDCAISDEKGRKLVDQLPINEYNEVVNLVMQLSGLTEKN